MSADQTNEPKWFYIVSLKYSRGGDIVLWRDDAKGYTECLEYAGKYSEGLIASRPKYFDNGDTTVAVPCEDIERRVRRVVGGSDIKEFIAMVKTPRAERTRLL